jgi:AcrR family transcriptional regulator
MTGHRSGPRPLRRPRQARSRFLFHSIVQATGDVLASAGAEGLTTTRVAERAGVSVGSLYQYFPDRETLIGEFVRSRFEGDAALMQQIVASGHGAELEAVVHAAISALVEHYRAQRELYAEVMRVLPAFDHTEEMRQISQRSMAFGTAWLKTRPEPELRDHADLGARLLFFGVRSALNGLVRECPTALDEESLGDRLTAAALAFLGRR